MNLSELIPIVAILSAFITPIFIVSIIANNNSRKRELLHETVNKMVEAGQTIPDSILSTYEEQKPKNNMQRGILFTFAGIGLGITLSLITSFQIASIAAVPLFVGFAYIILGYMDNKQNTL